MEELNLYDNLFNENYTDVRKNELIQKVFENKSKKLLSQKSNAIKMAKGGGVDDEKTYTPYEFLYELLPQVYGRPYVVSDEVGKQYTEKILQDEKELQEYTDSKLTEYGVNSLYKIDNKELIEEIEIRRRKLISDKTFITTSELHAYLFCHPELNTEHYLKEIPSYDVNSLRISGLVMVDYDTQTNSFEYVYVYEYLSGYVYKKLSRLIQYKDRLIELGVLTEEQFILQESALKNSFPTQGKITKDLDTCLFILPNSKFGNEFMISPEDMIDYPMNKSMSFIDTFRAWTETELDKALIKESRTLKEVHKYFTDFVSMSSNDDERVYSDRRKRAYNDGRKILLEFMNKGLNTNCQTRLEFMWNETYNSFAEAKYYKIPVACQLSNKFKNGKPFVPNETQVQSLQFAKSVGSGLLAYGVGVGKTASAIMNVSYALDNGICNKPLFIVPNATYSKWKKEMFGGVNQVYEVEYVENEITNYLTFENEPKAHKFAKAVNGKLRVKTEKINGHISHIKNVVELRNLNLEVVMSLKKYSDDDMNQMNNIHELVKYLKTIPKNYDFKNEEINKTIRTYYNDFDVDSINRDFDNLIDEEFSTYWDKNKKNHNFDYYEARTFFIKNILKQNIKEFFEKKIKIYNDELPYILGTLKSFDNGTIFIGTYEALEHLGLVMANNFEMRDNDSEFGVLFNEISQGDEVSEINFNVKRNIATIFKDAVYGKRKTKLDIREFGFDYVVFDESHLLKKAITDCKGVPISQTRSGSGTKMREKRKYKFGESELPSTLALTGYFITRYIQMQKNGRNVLHLTATPFTNKPAEIYSMLSLTNKEMLNNSDFIYMEQFFDVFMDISYDLIYGNTGVTRKESLLGYRNLPQLRNLIYSMMDYKSGEDANIKRPDKILLPNAEKGLETTIPETPQQDELFRIIKDYQRGIIDWKELCADAVEQVDVDEMTEDELINYVNDNGTDSQKEKFNSAQRPLSEEEFESLKNIVIKLTEKTEKLDESEVSDSEKDSFRVVRGLSLLKAVTLSPYLSMCQKQTGIEPTYTEYVESSPKLLYTIQSIQSIHNYEIENNLVKSGCVIYMNIGVNVSFKNEEGKVFKWKESGFEKIRQYLINKLGYTAEEVSIVSGGMTEMEKERAKNKFLVGKTTILIGSSSISTGVDLQNNASALFLCSFDWNPTDNEQISGRIHRQGNRFSKIRIVYPMVMNSADPNIFQQLYEKTLRIKNIWDRNDRGNTLDLKDFDVNSLRKGILDEPEDLANYWKEEQNEELTTLENVLNLRLDDLKNASNDKKILDSYTPIMKGIIVVLDAFKKTKKRNEDEERMNEKIGQAQEEYNNKLEELKEQLLKDPINFGEKYAEELEKVEQKFKTEKEKVSNDIYDFINDPDGRYRFLTYDEIGDGDELLKAVNKWITNSDSYFQKISKDDKTEIYYEFLREKFPRFQDGYYDLSKPQEEDTIHFVDFDSLSPITNANTWKGAYRGFGKIKENLEILGIKFEEIPQAVEQINEELNRISEKKDKIIEMFPQKLQEFIVAKEERMITQPSIQQRVDEFSAMNDILKETIPTFQEDRSKFVDIPLEKLEIKPNKKSIEKQIEEAVIIDEEEATIDTTNLISNLKNGLVVRFNVGINKKGNAKVVDIFYEEGEYIKYLAIENADGDVIDDEEEVITEEELINFYIKNNDKISEEFFDTGEEELEEKVVSKPVKKEKAEKITTKTKADTYKEIIEGYELALEIESDEEKINLYNELIDGYKLALELEN
jgi:cell division protein ZapA (FtsZ GTPase activity inhibitor)